MGNEVTKPEEPEVVDDPKKVITKCLTSVGPSIASTKELLSQASELAELSPLTADDRDFFDAARELAAVYGSRAATLAEIRAGDEIGRLDAETFVWIRSSDIVSVAATFASAQDFSSLSVVARRHHQALAGHLLAVASCIPETASPRSYADFLEAAMGRAKLRLVPGSDDRAAAVRNPAALEERLGIQPHNPPAPPKPLPAVPLRPDVAATEPEPYPPSQARRREWAMARALEVDDLSGMVARSSQLLHLCAEQLDVSGLADLIEAADQVCFVVYEHVPPQDVGLREFLAMEDLERLLLLTRGCSQESIVSVLKGPALATITHSNQKHEQHTPYLVERLLSKTADSSLEWVSPVVSTRLLHGDESLIPTIESAVFAASAAFASCTRTDKWKVMLAAIRAIPPRPLDDSGGSVLMAAAYDRLAELRECITMADLLLTGYSIEHTMDFYANLRINKEGALSLLSTMCSKGTVRLPDSAWEAILKDMVIVCDQLMSPTVSEIDCVRVFFGKLLKAKKFALAKTFLSRVPSADAEILATTREFVDSAAPAPPPSAGDPLSWAEECLAMASPSSAKSFEEHFISGLRDLRSAGAWSVPAPQIRAASRSPDGPVAAASVILAAQPRAASRIVELVGKFSDSMGEAQTHEVEFLAARTAFSEKDFETASKYCESLASSGHCASWELSRIILELTSFTCDDRRRCILTAHVAANCPDKQIPLYLAKWRECESRLRGAPAPGDLARLISFALDASASDVVVAAAVLMNLSAAEMHSSVGVLVEQIAERAASPVECKRCSDFVCSLIAARSSSRAGSSEVLEKLSLQPPGAVKLGPEHATQSADIAAIQAVAGSAQAFSEMKSDPHIKIPEGIDAAQFCSSPQQRRAIFSHLIQSGTPDEGLAGRLSELAQACGISQAELAVAVACWAFSSENKGGLPEVQAIVGKQRAALVADPVASASALVLVFPRIPGTNHERLGFYFATLRQCSPADATSQHPLLARAADHQKLLARLATISPPLDFSRLIDASSNPLEAVATCLTPANVHSVAKLVPLIVKCRGREGRPLTVSAIYLAWVRRVLGFEPPEEEPRGVPVGERARAFADKFATAREFIRKLGPAEATAVAEEIFRSSGTLVETKVAAIEEALQVARNRGSADEGQFAALLTNLQSSISELVRLRAMLPEKLQVEYDLAILSKGSERAGRFASLCEGAVRSGMPCTEIFDVGNSLQWPAPCKEIVDLFGALCESSLRDRLPLPPLLAALVSSVSARARPRSSLRKTAFCAACLVTVTRRARDFVNGDAPLQARVAVLELLEQIVGVAVIRRHGFTRSPVAMRISSIVAQAWRGTATLTADLPASDSAVPPPEQVLQFLRQTLSQGVVPEQIDALGEILALWQDASGECGTLGDAWFVLFSAMTRAGMAQDAAELRKRFSHKQVLSADQEALLAKEMPGQVAAAFVLASSNKQVNSLAASLFQAAPAPPATTSGASASPLPTRGTQVSLCRHKGPAARTVADPELYRVAVSSGNAPGLSKFDPSAMAAAVRERPEADRRQVIQSVVAAAQARGQQAHGAALLTEYNSSSSLLRSTSSITSLLGSHQTKRK